MLDSPEEWIRFLHHDAAGFAGVEVPPVVSERFHAASQAEALAAFLRPSG